MKIVRLDFLTRDGEPDPDMGSSFTINKSNYFRFRKIMDEQLGECIIKKGTFNEIYRNHSKDPESKHPALIIKKDQEDDMPWQIVWFETEKVWLAFELKDASTVADSYGSTVEVATPIRGDVYRISPYVAELLRQAYCIKCPLEKVYETAPKDIT